MSARNVHLPAASPAQNCSTAAKAPGRNVQIHAIPTWFVGIAYIWPLAGVSGHHLASLLIVGHSRRSRWSVWCSASALRFPVPNGTAAVVMCRGRCCGSVPGFWVLRRVVVMYEMRDARRADIRHSRGAALTGRPGPGPRGDGTMQRRPRSAVAAGDLGGRAPSAPSSAAARPAAPGDASLLDEPKTAQ
jgi:hypothetical protein